MRTLLIYISMFFTTLLGLLISALPLLVSCLFPGRLRHKFVRYVILKYGRAIVYLSIRPFIKIEYEDEAGMDIPAIYVFNHRSASDPFLMSVFNIEAIQIVNGWPMRLPFFGFFARRGEYIDVTKTNIVDASSRISSLIDRGVSIMSFPEGTRSGNRSMNKFRSGIFHIAKSLRIPIYPCAIAGNEELPKRSFRFGKGHVIKIQRMKPILQEEMDSIPTAFALRKRVHSIIQEKTLQLDSEIDDVQL